MYRQHGHFSDLTEKLVTDAICSVIPNPPFTDSVEYAIVSYFVHHALEVVQSLLPDEFIEIMYSKDDQLDDYYSEQITEFVTQKTTEQFAWIPDKWFQQAGSSLFEILFTSFQDEATIDTVAEDYIKVQKEEVE